jgi:hypothetical protein
LRGRCTNRPFFWKDFHVLGGGDAQRNLWEQIGFVGSIFILASYYFETQFVAAICAILVVPCVVSVKFDTLLTAEFRDETWDGLMLLPVPHLQPITQKVGAAIYEYRGILISLVVAIVVGLLNHVQGTLIALVSRTDNRSVLAN